MPNDSLKPGGPFLTSQGPGRRANLVWRGRAALPRRPGPLTLHINYYPCWFLVHRTGPIEYCPLLHLHLVCLTAHSLEVGKGSIVRPSVDRLRRSELVAGGVSDPLPSFPIDSDPRLTEDFCTFTTPAPSWAGREAGPVRVSGLCYFKRRTP